MSGTKVRFTVHRSHVPLWRRTDWRYAILMGGRGNGRSGTASRYAVSQLMGKEYTRGAIMRAVREDIRASCWSEIVSRIAESGAEGQFSVTQNDMEVKFGRNSLRAHGFRSSSGSLTARLKSLADYDFVWIEEGEEIGEDEFMRLDDTLRTVKGRIRIVITLNTPARSHWMLRKWFDMRETKVPGFYEPVLKESAKDVLHIAGTYRENAPNIESATLQRYASYRESRPKYYWQVIEGLSPDEVRGKVFTGWQQIDAVPREARLVAFGEDFGWNPDPACVVAVYYWNGSYVVDEVAYGLELSNEFLAGEIRKVGQATVVADSAEPKSIADQNSMGISVVGVQKGADSVVYRIKLASTKKILVTRRSRNVWDSYENYRWAEDRDGNPKGVPEHLHSHAMDAVTYAISHIAGRERGVSEEQERLFERTEERMRLNSAK